MSSAISKFVKIDYFTFNFKIWSSECVNLVTLRTFNYLMWTGWTFSSKLEHLKEEKHWLCASRQQSVLIHLAVSSSSESSRAQSSAFCSVTVSRAVTVKHVIWCGWDLKLASSKPSCTINTGTSEAYRVVRWMAWTRQFSIPSQTQCRQGRRTRGAREPSLQHIKKWVFSCKRRSRGRWDGRTNEPIHTLILQYFSLRLYNILICCRLLPLLPPVSVYYYSRFNVLYILSLTTNKRGWFNSKQ